MSPNLLSTMKQIISFINKVYIYDQAFTWMLYWGNEVNNLPTNHDITDVVISHSVVQGFWPKVTTMLWLLKKTGSKYQN